LMFNGQRTAFVMYAVKGRSWVALGDPIGPPAAAEPLAREFHERCTRAGGRTVFYQVRPENLHVYVDMGLSFVKLGEEGRVPLTRFPIAVVEQGGKIVAFANLWPGADHAELSIDLMRHLPDSSNGVMDMLFVGLMLWGAAEGYKYFNLGMAPLSGLADNALAPL